MIALLSHLGLDGLVSNSLGNALIGNALVAKVAPMAAEDSAPLSALVWWLIPLAGFIGAIGYVIWVTKFQSKYENETNRSVGRFQKFQQSLEKDRTFGNTSAGVSTSTTTATGVSPRHDDHLGHQGRFPS